eukprot:UN12896
MSDAQREIQEKTAEIGKLKGQIQERDIRFQHLQSDLSTKESVIQGLKKEEGRRETENSTQLKQLST